MALRIVTNKSLTSNVATLTLNSSSGMAVDDFIRVTGVDATFNGIFTISGVTSASTITYSKTAGDVSPAAASGSVEFIGNDDTGRPAYMYDLETDTWVAIAGKIDTGRNYTFTGANRYEAPVTYADKVTINAASAVVGLEIKAATGQASDLLQVKNSSASIVFDVDADGDVVATKGVNVFANSTARDAAIPAPSAGVVVFLTNTNQQQYYTGTAWAEIESGDFEAFLLAGM